MNFELSEGLAALGHRVVLFATEESQVPKGGFLFKACKEIGTVNVDWLQAEKSMWEKCDRYFDDLDVLLGSNWFGLEYSSKIRNPSLKVAHLHHGGLNPEWWNKSKPPFKTNFIAISNWMKRVYTSQGFNSVVAYNGINLERYKYQKDKGDRFLFLSRISRIKGVHTAIEVARRANVKLDVAGGTSFVDDPKYVEYIKSLCDGEQIRFIGEVSHEEKIRLYQNAKALIATPNFGEPMGLYIVESLACGTPVIGSLDGALPEIIQDGKCGYVCDVSKDIDSMVEAVRKVDSISPQACRDRAMFFSRERMAERYSILLNDVCEGREW